MRVNFCFFHTVRTPQRQAGAACTIITVTWPVWKIISVWCLWEIPYLFYGRLWYYLLLIWYLITNLRRKEGWLEFLTWFCDDLKHDANEDTSTDVDKKEVEIWDGNVLTWIVWRRAEWLMFFSLIAFHFHFARHLGLEMSSFWYNFT